MSSINYSEKIPNNVNLSDDRTLQRALEQWQPNFINWWDDVGPVGSTDSDVYHARPSVWTHKAGRSLATSRCATTAGAFS